MWKELKQEDGSTIYSKLIPSYDFYNEIKFPFTELRVRTSDRVKIDSIGCREFNLEGITAYEYHFKDGNPAGFTGTAGKREEWPMELGFGFPLGLLDAIRGSYRHFKELARQVSSLEKMGGQGAIGALSSKYNATY